MTRRRLSEHQKKRIASQQDSRRQRAAGGVGSGVTEVDADTEVHSGQIVVRHGRNLVIHATDGRHVPAVWRANVGELVCGDHVSWIDDADGAGVVVAVSPRRNVLSRPAYGGRDKAIAANLSLLVVVLAPEPEPSGYLVDQYLVAAERIGIDALICLNKSDLLDAEGHARFRQRFGFYDDIGYPVIQISARTAEGMAPLRERMRGQTSILVGQSGVGKSSLVNAMVTQGQALEGRLSDATGQGRHTTSATTLYRLDGGGGLIDSPGVRSFRLGRLSQAQLAQGFREFQPYLGHCRFDDCVHVAEPACAIDKAAQAGLIQTARVVTYRRLLAASLASVDYGDS